MKINTISLALVVSVALGGFTGCGKGGAAANLLKSIRANALTQNGDIYAQVAANLNTDAFSMAAFALPISDPNTGIQYGTISLSPLIGGGGGQLRITANVSAIANINSSTDAKLPNGTDIPITISTATNFVGIPIGQSGAKLYVALDRDLMVVGTAIPFSALDGVGQYAPGVNLFSMIASGNVNAFVGIFAGSGPSQTGIGVFADLSSILPKATPASTEETQSKSMVLGSANQLRSSVEVVATKPVVGLAAPTHSSDAEDRLYRQLWRESQNAKTLRYR